MIFISKPKDAYLANFFYGITLTIVFFIYWVNYFRNKNYLYFSFSFLNIKKKIFENYNIFISSISTHFSINSALIILTFFVTDKELGRFTLAFKIALLIRMLPVFYVQSSLQKAKKIYVDSSLEFKKLINKYYKNGIIITLTIGLMTLIFSNEIIKIFAGEYLEYSSNILNILSFMPFFAMLNYKNMIYILVNDFQKILNLSSFITLLFMLFFSITLSYNYGGLGLAYALVLTEIISFLCFSFFIIKNYE